jgi:hypothetical protein
MTSTENYSRRPGKQRSHRALRMTMMMRRMRRSTGMIGWTLWLRRGLPRESSLSIEGRSPRAEPPRRESGDPDLGGSMATGGGEEPPSLQESALSERTEGARPQWTVGSSEPLLQPDSAETVAIGKRPCPEIAVSIPSGSSQKRPHPTSLR